MARAQKVERTNASTLNLARVSAGFSVSDAATILGVEPHRLDEWESGDETPTLGQLRKIANLYETTIAALLARQSPEFARAPQVLDFRAADVHGAANAPALAREVRRARHRRERYLELVGDGAPEMLSIPIRRGAIDTAAAGFRKAVGVDVDEQTRFADARAALSIWIAAIEQLGALVFQVSRIPTTTFLGMSVYELRAPIILLNGADTPERRIFTLFHEVAHVLRRTSGICDVYTDGSASEAVCNQFSAAFLLPAEAVRGVLRPGDPIPQLAMVARRFRVSQSAVAVRLRELELISGAQLATQLALARRLSVDLSEKKDDNNGFAPAHILKLRNLGERYTTTVLDAWHGGRIDSVDTAYYLESKLGTIDKMELELARRSARRA